MANIRSFVQIEELIKKDRSQIVNDTAKLYNHTNEGNEQVPYEEEDMSDDIRVDEWTINYRKRNLDMELNRIRDMALGRYESFLPLVEDKKGRLSDRKIKSFIKDLIDSHPDSSSISKDKRKLLELLMYCVITGPSGISSRVQPIYFTTEYGIPCAFMEFIKAAGDHVFQEDDRLKLVRDEEYSRAYPEDGAGFSFFQNLMLSLDEDRSFYTDEELKEAAETLAELIGDNPDNILKTWKEDAKDKKEPAAVSIPEKEDLHDDAEYVLPEPDWDVLNNERNWYEQRQSETYTAYQDHLPANCHLNESYIELRKMLYSADRSDIAQMVEEMVDAYLISHDISPLCYKKGYGLVSNKITQFSDEISNAVERARKYR